MLSVKERSHKGAQRGFAVLSRLSTRLSKCVVLEISWNKHLVGTPHTWQLLPLPSLIVFISPSHQPARWRRLNHSLLLWLLFLYRFIEFCLMQLAQFRIKVAEPGDLPLL